jgi:CitMHS family citrate-Mg2+:H+ or citrate-Ca2+:H+ symporter
MIALLFTGKIAMAHIFMIGTGILLLVNFKGLKEQSGAIQRHSMPPYTVVSIMLAAGMLVGMLNETPMLKEMAGLILKAIPDAAGPYLHVIMAFISLPLGIMIGFDAFLFGIVPLFIKVGQSFGITPEMMGQAMLIGKNLGQSLQPVSHVPYLAIALLGGELKDYWGFTFKYVSIITVLAIIFAILTGLFPLRA